MVNDSSLTSLTFKHPLRIRSKKWVPVHRGTHGQEPGETAGRLRRVEITWWQKMLGFLAPRDVGSSEWKDEDGSTTVTCINMVGCGKRCSEERGTLFETVSGSALSSEQEACEDCEQSPVSS